MLDFSFTKESKSSKTDWEITWSTTDKVQLTSLLTDYCSAFKTLTCFIYVVHENQTSRGKLFSLVFGQFNILAFLNVHRQP